MLNFSLLGDSLRFALTDFSNPGPLKELAIFIHEALDRKTALAFCWITMAMRELFKNKKLLLRWVKYGKSKRPVPI